MSEKSPTRARLHPAAVTALALAGICIAGAVGWLVWLLAQPVDPNAEASQRLVQWQEVFERYRAANGSLPDMPFGGYCLGDGFPVGTGGTTNCRDYESTTYYTEEASAPLMDALASVAELPRGATTPVRGTVGPYALYDEAGVRLLTAENGTCEAPAVEVWRDGGGLFVCQILLER